MKGGGKTCNLVRRSREEILVGILKSCAEERMSITHLMVSQNLSYTLLRTHLNRLTSAGLVICSVDGERKLVGTTSRGMAVLKCYRSALALLNGYETACSLVTIEHSPLLTARA
jgi:predicted transcriptional regulator